jgi:tryptophan-rich sensory protein
MLWLFVLFVCLQNGYNTLCCLLSQQAQTVRRIFRPFLSAFPTDFEITIIWALVFASGAVSGAEVISFPQTLLLVSHNPPKPTRREPSLHRTAGII